MTEFLFGLHVYWNSVVLEVFDTIWIILFLFPWFENKCEQMQLASRLVKCLLPKCIDPPRNFDCTHFPTWTLMTVSNPPWSSTDVEPDKASDLLSRNTDFFFFFIWSVWKRLTGKGRAEERGKRQLSISFFNKANTQQLFWKAAVLHSHWSYQINQSNCICIS